MLFNKNIILVIHLGIWFFLQSYKNAILICFNINQSMINHSLFILFRRILDILFM